MKTMPSNLVVEFWYVLNRWNSDYESWEHEVTSNMESNCDKVYT